ncbi:GH1 family beta-glucosidase [Terriglobus roseus]|uniref:Beta-glucosidase n=1 Tax=Terriglobus roseus TaxID=392734 RepID=A0A1H4Q943_9BACT|nr:GH1 family beta-glucosidase [Terriglobus roseus]SEC16154.1 beta-glucosidase [Terriglobus roseus]
MPSRFSRRTFVQIASSFGAAAALPFRMFGAPPSTAKASATSDRRFPAGFLWGSATASYQVEGAVGEDGRGKTIWDTFSHTAGKTHNGDTGDVATDSYHRYAEDIALMKDLGLKTCRFSVAWSRIFPDGAGQPNQKGIDHYRAFCQALHAAGIEPWCTLYHWDLPQTLEDKGGWQDHDTAKLFADYASYTAGKLADVCSHFMTMNEISTFVDLGYGNGIHAPGLKLGRGKLAQVRHHAVLGHGLAVQAIRAAAPHAKVGSAENLQAIVPVFDSPEHVAAAKKATVEENAGYLTVMRTGKYTDQYLRTLGADAPKFTPEEMKAIGSPLDFQGLNIYTATYARAVNNAKGYDIVGNPSSYPHMESPWLTIGPDALYWAPRLANECWNLKEIYITENGCSAADAVAGDGHIYDTDRVMYLRNYLTHLQRATSEGVPVKGYFLWSLLDNYEWADGYDKRFGITYVDFKTQKRTPKLSSEFYKNVIVKNSL